MNPLTLSDTVNLNSHSVFILVLDKVQFLLEEYILELRSSGIQEDLLPKVLGKDAKGIYVEKGKRKTLSLFFLFIFFFNHSIILPKCPQEREQ